MQVLSDTGRVAISQSGLVARLQERWPTEHGYALQVVEGALNSMLQAGSVHRSPAGKWTRFLNLSRETSKTPAAPPVDPPADEPEAVAPDEATTKEMDVEKTKVCTGKCGKEKPIGEFYAKCAQCKRCVLDRQKELKAANGGKSAPKAAKAKRVAAAAPIAKSPALKNLKAKAAAKTKDDPSPRLDFAPMLRTHYQLSIFDTGGDKHEFMVDHDAIKRLQAELKEVA